MYNVHIIFTNYTACGVNCSFFAAFLKLKSHEIKNKTIYMKTIFQLMYIVFLFATSLFKYVQKRAVAPVKATEYSSINEPFK